MSRKREVWIRFLKRVPPSLLKNTFLDPFKFAAVCAKISYYLLRSINLRSLVSSDQLCEGAYSRTTGTGERVSVAEVDKMSKEAVKHNRGLEMTIVAAGKVS